MHHNPQQFLVDLSKDDIPYFDVVVIGSGMGGGSAVYKLCEAGLKVLLIEKGHSFLQKPEIPGIEVEVDSPDARMKRARWPHKLGSRVDSLEANFYVPLGCGLGGSTLLYGGALERLSRSDFERRSLPDGRMVEWPYSYSDLEPFYSDAENIFSVHGTPDSLEPGATYNLKTPPALNETDSYLFSLFEQSGLHPYHLHVAVGYQDNVRNKENVAGSLECCIIPALETGNLNIAINAEALELEASRDSVTSIQVKQEANICDIPVADKKVLIACGAYFTPALLLKSANRFWQNGLGNTHDHVGRNLMFHTSDFIGIWLKKQHAKSGADKTIGIRDFYTVQGIRHGQIQSTGMQAKTGYVLYALRMHLYTSFFGKIPVLNKILRQLLRIPAYLAAIFFREVPIFASIVEDYPYRDNRITLDETKPSGICFHYEIRDELRDRTLNLRKMLSKAVKGHWVISFNPSVTLNYGHPCGTCLSGKNPEESVTDSNGRIHGINNTYIADASFMPTSGGTNPSLTVAAHSLKVSDNLIKEIKGSQFFQEKKIDTN